MKNYKIETIMTFGKHEGKTIQEILKDDSKYIDWCIIYLDHFSIDSESFTEIKQSFPQFNLSLEAEVVLKDKQLIYKEEVNNKASFYEEEDDREESRSFDNYNGSYAQDVEGYSDQDIDDAFDGDPDAYWNID